MHFLIGWVRCVGKTMGDTILYFGCRKQSEDYLYRQELEQYLADGVLTKLYVAFSRDSDKKVYVQNLISQDANRAEIWKILEEGGHIYVCG
jgi:NADPH-ferrihemoprotein reductase